MSPIDDTGRISKQAFVASTILLFALALTSVCARFYIRIRVQKQVSIDDGVLLFGTCCLICATAFLFTTIDQMYLAQAAVSSHLPLHVTPILIKDVHYLSRIVVVVDMLMWCSVVSVKFGFLFLFRKLIDRIPPMVIYWRFVMIFISVVSAFGVTIYIASCPYFTNLKALQCSFGPHLQATVGWSLSQMAIDIMGDLLILYIPCRLIWKVRIRWTQKLALASCLCLTIVIMACTIVRISGLLRNGMFDFQWETYWLSIQANVGIIMAAITAFRTFFISRCNERAQLSGGRGLRWYTQSTQAFRRILTPWSWRTMSATKISAGSSNEEIMELPRTSRATMTGVQTFINGPENSAVAGSQLTRSAVREENEGIWPLPEHEQDSHSIKVQHDVSVTSEYIHATGECV